MADVRQVLERAAADPRLRTASAFRVLIMMAPELDALEFRSVKQLRLVAATRMHKTRVHYALKQLVAAEFIERRLEQNGMTVKYRFGRAAVDQR